MAQFGRTLSFKVSGCSIPEKYVHFHIKQALGVLKKLKFNSFLVSAIKSRDW